MTLSTVEKHSRTKNIIHGILRLLLALATAYLLYLAVPALAHERIGLYNRGSIIGRFIAIMILLCFVAYMSVNGVREFMRRRIRLRLLYAITALATLAIIMFAVKVASDSSPDKSDLISYVALAVMLYFTVVDFIELFVRKREEKFYTDGDFEAADAEK